MADNRYSNTHWYDKTWARVVILVAAVAGVVQTGIVVWDHLKPSPNVPETVSSPRLVALVTSSWFEMPPRVSAKLERIHKALGNDALDGLLKGLNVTREDGNPERDMRRLLDIRFNEFVREATEDSHQLNGIWNVLLIHVSNISEKSAKDVAVTIDEVQEFTVDKSGDKRLIDLSGGQPRVIGLGTMRPKEDLWIKAWTEKPLLLNKIKITFEEGVGTVNCPELPATVKNCEP